MSVVVNRDTFEVRQNVNIPDYPPQQWLINPDMSQVEGYPNYFWEIERDAENNEILTVMDEEERDTLPWLLEQTKASYLAALDAKCTEQTQAGFVSSAIGRPCLFRSAPDDQLNLVGSVLMLLCMSQQNPAAELPYATYDPETNTIKNYDEYTFGQLVSAFGDGATYKLAQLQKMFALQQQVDAATSVSQVLAITW